MRRTPQSFKTATWQCTLPIDENGHQGVGFNTEDGGVIRLYLDEKSVVALRETLQSDYFVKVNQALKSSGNPIDDVSSTPEMEKVCPPVRASTAS